MSFRAKKESQCEACKLTIRVGDYLTWSRVTRAAYHIECWQKTLQYAEWKAKEEARRKATMGAEAETATTRFPFELAEEQEITESKVIPLIEKSKSEGDNQALDVLGQAIWQRIAPKVNHLDGFEDKFNALKHEIEQTISTEIEKAKAEMPKPTVVMIENKDTGENKDLGIQHKVFPTLVKMLSGRDHEGHRLNIWLVGPAGTGKSQATQTAAKALGLRYASTGSIIESYKVLGHFSPGTGEYKTTTFRDFWENGGLFCFDDFDGSDPNCVVELLAISNRLFAFPDAMVPRHADFCLVLTANTWGLGGTTDYVGRLKQDAAFINRFVSLHWEIDEELELATCPNLIWAKRVQQLRSKVQAKGIKVMITPRQSYQGAALLAIGMTQCEVEEIVLKQSMTLEQWESVQ